MDGNSSSVGITYIEENNSPVGVIWMRFVGVMRINVVGNSSFLSVLLICLGSPAEVMWMQRNLSRK